MFVCVGTMSGFVILNTYVQKPGLAKGEYVIQSTLQINIFFGNMRKVVITQANIYTDFFPAKFWRLPNKKRGNRANIKGF